MKRSTGFSVFLMSILALAGCDQGSSGLTGPEHEAVVTGEVTSETPPAGSSSMAMAPGIGAQTAARTVAIGQLSSSGTFTAIAEAEVNAQGGFRIEGVPSGRSELVIIARSDTNAEVGRVVLHEETVASTEHRAHPINARSTLHGRVWAQMKADGQSSMGAAELALFLDVRSDVALSAAGSQSTVNRWATAAARADAAITATLAAGGTPMSAAARNSLLLTLAAERDRSRAAGASLDATHRSYTEAAIGAFGGAGVKLQVLATAYAAAATSIRQEMDGAEEGARREALRTAVLLNIETRKRVAAAVQGSALGLKSAATSHVAALEARVRSAGTHAELVASIRNERGEADGRIAAELISVFALLPTEVRIHAEAQLQAALDNARLWVGLNGTTSASAMAQAATAFHAEVRSRAEAAVEAIPTSARGNLTVDAMVAVLVAIGACSGV